MTQEPPGSGNHPRQHAAWLTAFRRNRTARNYTLGVAVAVTAGLILMLFWPDPDPVRIVDGQLTCDRAVAEVGHNVTMEYVIETTPGRPAHYGFGASIATRDRNSEWSDPDNDEGFDVHDGDERLERDFVVPAGIPPGEYILIGGLGTAVPGSSDDWSDLADECSLTITEATSRNDTTTTTTAAAAATATLNDASLACTPNTQIRPGETITMTFEATLNGVGTITRGLGASLILPDESERNYPEGDITVELTAPTTTQNRPFLIPTDTTPGDYQLVGAIWDGAIGTGSQEWTSGCTITITEATSRNDTTTTTTAAAAATATLNDASLACTPNTQIRPGETITMTFEATLNGVGTITRGLGASLILPDESERNYPEGDITVELTAPTTTQNRPFLIPTDTTPGDYQLVGAIWDGAIGTGSQEWTSGCTITITEATSRNDTTTTTTAAAAATATLNDASLACTPNTQIRPGETITMTFEATLNGVGTITRGLGASLILPDESERNYPEGDITVELTAPTTTQNRPFLIPTDTTPGDYQLVGAIWDGAIGTGSQEWTSGCTITITN